ncbi:MAG: serine hydrolase domain-containing protein [Pseudomonadota bacterium]|nr:serine hydrolase domain-containing protein [Pseudomonadota bacterium]
MLKSFVTALALAGATLASASAQPSPHLDPVDAAVEPLMEAGHFPGMAIAVLREGEPVHVGSYGLASIEHAVPVTPDTVFELASLTKHMTALAVLTLAQDGRISLDDPVGDYIPGAPEAWSGIMIDHLLSHTGGLAHRFEDKPGGEFLLNYTTDDMLASAMATEMVAEPGEDWNYSDQGYFLLGLVIEAVTGEAYGEHLRAQYFRPLGMDATGLLDQSAIVPHRAEGYAWSEGGGLVRNRRVWQFGLTSHFGVTSSLNDMMAWEAELSEPDTIDVLALAASSRIQRPFDTGESCETWGYARGWMAYHRDGRTLVSHGGYAGTAYVRDLTTGLSVIVLTNREDTPDALSPMAIAWAAAHAADAAIPENGPACWE